MGWSKRQLGRAVAGGELVRVRQGWYSAPELREELQEAFRVGGALTCTKAARAHGMSARRTFQVHVAVPAHGSRLRDPADHRTRLKRGRATVHWVNSVRSGTLIRSPQELLRDMAFCQPVEFTIAAADSALRLRLVTSSEWRALCNTMPRGLRRLLLQATGKAESITESLVRVRLLGLGIPTQVQFRVPGIGRVDLLVGRRLILEVDGYEYHSSPEDFERDRRRDARLSVRGYRVLRFSYQQVMSHWGEVKGSVLAAIARGDHLAP